MTRVIAAAPSRASRWPSFSNMRCALAGRLGLRRCLPGAARAPGQASSATASASS
ncbi:MAG: hypothetical protein MZV70_65340 [Desulfobacterales bacterium]|nr:hypothetical protein [Desulfobacterales bacterium]